jgi:hypothetical protein
MFLAIAGAAVADGDPVRYCSAARRCVSRLRPLAEVARVSVDEIVNNRTGSLERQK